MVFGSLNSTKQAASDKLTGNANVFYVTYKVEYFIPIDSSNIRLLNNHSSNVVVGERIVNFLHQKCTKSKYLNK